MRQKSLRLFKALPAVAVFFACALTFAQAGESGTFKGDLVLKEIAGGDNSSFELVNDFSFVDSNSRLWTAPKGIVVNGASIPKFFWSFIGGPWSGKYKRASVIHDHFCETKSRKWDDVHRVFYDAMIASGVSELKAKLMYFAVYRFGPRWTDTEHNFRACLATFVEPTRDMNIDDATSVGFCAVPTTYSARLHWSPDVDESKAKKQAEQILTENPSLDEIRAMANRDIRQGLSYQKFKDLLSRELSAQNIDPMSDGRIKGLTELGLAD